jgi:FtsP/CotA-like multicopper oxidase with cupredoxin domain
MLRQQKFLIDRRALLSGSTALAAAAMLPRRAQAQTQAVKEFRLTAAPGRVALAGAGNPQTAVWSFSGQVPGPEIRVRQGERVRIHVKNDLPEETTVHWHGVRVPNAMDGVPHLTQKPIAPGDTFAYEFDCADAGSFWYHPHVNSASQVGRGLYGALIVEEREPLTVDRDITWVLDDWRLTKAGAISDDFGNMHDVSHAGRIGNFITVNGTVPERFEVKSGERIRLRLINTANARVFGLVFEDHAPMIVAMDGHPVTPHAPEGNRVVIGPAMRVDLVIDMAAGPNSRFAVFDRFYRGFEYRLFDLVYAETPLRDAPPARALSLSANPLTEPDLAGATRHDILLGGGMMGQMASAQVDGKTVDIRSMFQRGLIWAINGVASTEHVHAPLLTVKRGSSHILAIANETAWWHPMHLHGHAFRVLSRNGAPTRHREWQDTVLIPPRERVEIAFAADNPGDWMFHCHVLEHQAGGMMATLRVA